jgi:hypothetical protein
LNDEQNVLGGDHDLFEDTIPTFSRSTWGKPCGMNYFNEICLSPFWFIFINYEMVETIFNSLFNLSGNWNKCKGKVVPVL